MEPQRLKDLASRVRENRFLRRWGSFGMTAGRIPQTETLTNTLIYIVRHKSREDAKKSWSAFSKDEAWQSAYKASIADGRLVKKVESVYMDTTDYSPELPVAKSAQIADGGFSNCESTTRMKASLMDSTQGSAITQ
jgi:hypothetical protein